MQRRALALERLYESAARKRGSDCLDRLSGPVAQRSLDLGH